MKDYFRFYLSKTFDDYFDCQTSLNSTVDVGIFPK